MDIYINNRVQQLPDDAGINELLGALNITTRNGIALAVNNTVVPKDEWNSYILKANDKITVIKATQGG